MEIPHNTQELKFRLKNIENILLAEVLIRSLKGNQSNTALPATIRGNQRNLFSSAVSYSKSMVTHTGYKAQITNKRMDTLSVIIELLNKVPADADFVIQNLVDFLKIVSQCRSKIDTEKYSALLRYFSTEVRNEFEGKETTLNYNSATDTIYQEKEERIHGT